MKLFEYDGKVYKNEANVRTAIWLKERKALPLLRTTEQWESFGVLVSEVSRADQTDEELANDIRKKRNALLAESDFFLMPDYEKSPNDLEEVVAYRQALRDVTSQVGFPKDVDFPKLPKALKVKNYA